MRNIIVVILTLFVIQQSYCQNSISNYLVAHSYMKSGNFDSSIVYFNRAIKEKPSDYEAIYQRGICYYNLKMYTDANRDFRNVNKRYNGKASLMLSKTELKLNHPEIAINLLREHLSSPYKLPEDKILLDPDLSSLEGSAAWNNLWKEKEWYNSREQRLQEARYLISTGDDLEALNVLEDLQKKGVSRSMVHLYKGEIFLRTGNKKAALDELTSSINVDFRNTKALALRASLYFEQEKFDAALTDVKNLLRYEPESFEHYLFSARLKSKLNDYRGALKDAETYIALFPSDPEGYIEKGKIHFGHGKYLDAIASYNQALTMDKGNPEIYFARGITYAATGTHRYAIKDFSMSLDLDPNDADTWFAKGLSDLKMGNREDACFDFRKAAQYGIFEARSYVEQLCE